MAAWEIVVTDKTYRPMGEVDNAKEFSHTRALSKLATCSFKVRLDHKRANDLAANGAHIKAYRNKVLRFFGPIISVEEAITGSDAVLAVNAADVGWVLGKRLVGKSAKGFQQTTAKDRALIAKDLIDFKNTDGETGISTTTYTPSAGSATTYDTGPYRPTLDCVSDLGGSLDGFDWRILPLDNWLNNAVTSQKIGAIQMLPLIGAKAPTLSKPNAVFEYGAGRKNVLSFTRTVTRDTQANRIFHVVNGTTGAGVVQSTDANATQSMADFGLLEAVAQAEITDATLRAKLVAEHQNVRKNPRNIVQMTPHIDPGVTGKMPQVYEDYDLGDTIRVRLVYGGFIKFDGIVRVYGFTIQANENGLERVDLLLENQ